MRTPMNNISAFRWLSVVLLLLIPLLQSHAADVGTVTRLSGTADVTRGDAPASALQLGDAIQQQDVVRTRSGASLEITLSDGSRLTLGENTQMAIAEFATGASPASLLEVTRGRLRAFVTDLFSSRNESFRVRTATAVAGVQGTDFAVLAEAELTRVIVYQGVVVTANADPRIKGREVVRAGQSTVIKKGQPPEPAESLSAYLLGSGAGTLNTLAPILGGGQLDLRASGEQGKEPILLTPRVPSSVPTPPIPRPPPL